MQVDEAGGDGDHVIDRGCWAGEQPTTLEIVNAQIKEIAASCYLSTYYPTSEYIFVTDKGEPERFQEA